MPLIKKTFLYSTNTFAPNWEKNWEKMPPIKKTFLNSTNTFAPNLKNMPPIK